MTEHALLTVGHGTSDADAFVALLRTAGVASVVDVRSYPGSRRVPHMARVALAEWLPSAGIAYTWEPRLGGRRRTSAHSPNVALEQPGFRAYADYMSSTEYAEAEADLLTEIAQCRTAIMCAESLWWRCHRRLIADSVVLLDHVSVEHLFHDGRIVSHTPMPVARVDGAHLVYDLSACVRP